MFWVGLVQFGILFWINLVWFCFVSISLIYFYLVLNKTRKPAKSNLKIHFKQYSIGRKKNRDWIIIIIIIIVDCSIKQCDRSYTARPSDETADFGNILIWKVSTTHNIVNIANSLLMCRIESVRQQFFIVSREKM